MGATRIAYKPINCGDFTRHTFTELTDYDFDDEWEDAGYTIMSLRKGKALEHKLSVEGKHTQYEFV